ncbi:MAG TPA: hypothetical protein VK754_02620, partial [Propionibacteriaceae bacterium]|nr:hypothetical protein [Propionibacteriaceae bacterium]
MRGEGRPWAVLFRRDDLVIEELVVERIDAEELSGDVANLHCSFDLAMGLRFLCQELKDAANGLPVLQENEEDDARCEWRGGEQNLQGLHQDHGRECRRAGEGRPEAGSLC